MNKPLLSGIGLLLVVLLLGRLSDCIPPLETYLLLLVPGATSSKERSSASTTQVPTTDVRRPRIPVSSSSQLQPMTQPTAEDSTLKPLATYTVKYGDRLWLLAQQFYGDGRLWRRIAEANNIDHPFHIYAGNVLVIPAKDE